MTVHLAGALAEMGYRVAIFDCDSQGDLSAVLLADHEKLPYTLADLFAGTGILTKELLQRTAYENIVVIPADHRLNLVDKTHGFERDRSVTALADAVSEIECDFDFILFDCPPRPHLSGFAALVAAREVIVPCQPSQFSVRSMVTLHEEIRTVQQSLNPNLKIRGYFLSLVPPRSRIQETCRQLLVERLWTPAMIRGPVKPSVGGMEGTTGPASALCTAWDGAFLRTFPLPRSCF